MVYKIAFYDSKSYDRQSFLSALERLKLVKHFELHFFEPRLDLNTVSFSKECQAVCLFVNDDLGPEVLAVLDEQDIQLVLLRCAGFDNIDLRAAGELDLSVCRVPAYSPNAVSEFAVALLLTLIRKVHRAYNRVRDGNFTLQGFVGFDLNNKTVGVIGTGKIGYFFIKAMLGFGCNILAYDMYPSDVVRQLDNVKYVSLNELYINSDIISLHAPATPETTHMINTHAINLMKPGVVIINTSRGALIDTRALVEGLITQRIGAAGLDVYENEKKYFFRDISDEEIDDELLARLQNMRNVIVTSHQAFLTQEALDAIAITTLTNAKEFLLEHKTKNALTNYVTPPTPNPAVARALSLKYTRGASGESQEKTPIASN